MLFRNLLHNKKLIIFFLLIFSAIVIYFILRVLVFGSDPLIPFVTSILDTYLLLAERFANQLLQWSNSDASITNHTFFFNDVQQYTFKSEVVLKKFAFILILLIWLTSESSTRNKIYYTLLSLITHYLFVSLYLAFGAYQTTSIIFNESMLIVPIGIGNISFISILFLWYLKNKEPILQKLNIFQMNLNLLDTKIRSIYFIACLYIIIIKVLPVYFDFYLWVHFLSKSSQLILGLIGLDSEIEPFYLNGMNGSLHITTGCIGLVTLFLYASVVYLTGNNNKSRLIYITSGLIFLNLVNTLRLVFLFQLVQNVGIDMKEINNFHDIYNYIVYVIIFILWVIWIEKFSDIRKTKNSIYKGILNPK
jgi:exosortase/archaeosortase family protein